MSLHTDPKNPEFVSRKSFINSQKQFIALKPEANLGEKVTETAGYIPPNVRIKQMIESGERLEQWKKENFDYDAIDQDGDEIIPDDDDYSSDGTRQMDETDFLHAGKKAIDRLRDLPRKQEVKNAVLKQEDIKSDQKKDKGAQAATPEIKKMDESPT